MKALITGAAGFIGSQLAYKLWKTGISLVLVDNFSYGKPDNLIFPDHDFTPEIIRMDIRDKEGIASIFRDNDIDYAYNIAGIAPLPDCQADPAEAISVNVSGFVNICEAARKYGVRTIIQASTNAIYENETRFPVTEAGFSVLPTLIYPNTKYCAERFAQSFCDTYGMNIVCLRFSNVYGPHIDCLRTQPPFVAYMIRELYYNRTPVFHSDGNQRRDYVYVDDLTDLAWAVRECRGFDCVNASSGVNYSVNEMFSIAYRLVRKTAYGGGGLTYADDRHYWEKYPALYEGRYRIKDEILHHEINKYSLCDNTHAREKYGWSPRVSMEEGLAAVIEYTCSLLSGMEQR